MPLRSDAVNELYNSLVIPLPLWTYAAGYTDGFINSWVQDRLNDQIVPQHISVKVAYIYTSLPSEGFHAETKHRVLENLLFEN